MSYGDFLVRVKEHGTYPDREEAARVTQAVVGVFGRRLQPESAGHLADQLPAELGGLLTARRDPAATWGLEEFLERAAQATDAPDADTARGHVQAVLSTVGETVTGGELNKLISQLPSAYAAMFGHPELS